MSFASYPHPILLISGQTFEVTVALKKFWDVNTPSVLNSMRGSQISLKFMSCALHLTGGVTSMNSFLKRFFPEVYHQKQDSKVSHYCQFNSELLTLFTSSLYIAGLVATLVASSITRRYGRRASILIGGTFFITGSVFGGAAVNIPMLLFNRILLGIGLGFTNQVTL